MRLALRSASAVGRFLAMETCSSIYSCAAARVLSLLGTLLDGTEPRRVVLELHAAAWRHLDALASTAGRYSACHSAVSCAAARLSKAIHSETTSLRRSMTIIVRPRTLLSYVCVAQRRAL